MTSIVIAEKPDQAGRYRAAVGSRFGEIFAARGHLFELMPPEKMKKEWETWSIGLMWDGAEFYPQRLNPGRDRKDAADLARRYAAIRDKAKVADTIYIATDPDREGEGIGRNIVAALRRDIGWKGRVLRVLEVSQDASAIAEAFQNAEPGENGEARYQSYLARANADHIFNLSLTRSASEALRPAGERVVVSVGRVLTPTLGIVCRRELAIQNHVPRDYWHPWVSVVGAAGRAKLTHNPGEKGRMFDVAEAERIADLCKAFAGPINVKRERKKQKPPALFSLSTLQVEGSRRLKWSIEKTTDVMQSIYEKKLVTYPRSSEVSLPESEIENAPALFAGILGLPFMSGVTYASGGPVIRREKGAFSDKDLKGAAHYAIIPDVRSVNDWPNIVGQLTPDEKRLFEVIARRYLASVSPHRVYDATALWVEIAQREFRATGTVEVEPGWREALGRTELPKDEEDDGEDDDGALPPFQNGDAVTVGDVGVQKLTTKPPARFTDATLQAQMIEAWREVSDPTLRDILKETNGIGTVATRTAIIKNLIARNFLRVEKGSLFATDGGMMEYRTFVDYCPDLLDAGLTAQMELKLNNIQSGETTALDVVKQICGIAETAIRGFVAAKGKGVVIHGLKGAQRGGGKPTSGMIAAAKAKAARLKQAVPSGVLSDFQKCRAYLGDMPPRGEGGAAAGPRPPSEAQLRFAQKIAGERGVTIPDDVLKESRKVSEWIEKNKAGGGGGGGAGGQSSGGSAVAPGAPSPKQIEWAERIASQKGIELPSYARADRTAISKWIDANKKSA